MGSRKRDPYGLDSVGSVNQSMPRLDGSSNPQVEQNRRDTIPPSQFSLTSGALT